ncbi:MAG TPA: FIST N-terminal domain-containing protein [Polyangiaceae bacterium]
MKLHTFSTSATDARFEGLELDSPDTLVLVFGPSDLADSPAVLRALHDAFSASQLLGCSTAGEIFDSKVSDGTLSVAVVRFEHTRVRSAAFPVTLPTDSREAGRSLARELLGSDLRSILVLSDGLGVNGSELARGINDAAPPPVVVTGGLAADGDRFRRTWVLTHGEPRSGFVSAVGLYGDHVHVGHGSKGGWDIFGPERVVTRAQGNVLFELDGRPALDLYKEYLGERASGLPATALLFPLALRAGRSDVHQVVRTVLAVDEAKRSMTFAGDIPEGSLAQLMKANFDRLVEGASVAAMATTDAGAPPNVPGLLLSISCVGRRLVLGERTEEEIEATLEAMPSGTKQIGFYSYGELSPHASGSCDLHNQTMTLTTIREW